MNDCIKHMNVYNDGYEWVEGEMQKFYEYLEETDQAIERKHIKFVNFILDVEDQSTSFALENKSLGDS